MLFNIFPIETSFIYDFRVCSNSCLFLRVSLDCLTIQKPLLSNNFQIFNCIFVNKTCMSNTFSWKSTKVLGKPPFKIRPNFYPLHWWILEVFWHFRKHLSNDAAPTRWTTKDQKMRKINKYATTKSVNYEFI